MSEKIGMQDLVVLLAEKANITQKDAETLIKGCFDMMEKGLVEDKFLKIKNLGTFKLIHVENRKSVNVSTGERVLIPAHYKVTFTPDIELADRVNTPYVSFGNVEVKENETKINDEEEEEFEGKLTESNYLLTETERQEEEEEEPAYSDNDKKYQSHGVHNGLFWLFFFILSGLIVFFAGHYFCPMISSWGEKPAILDSIVVFSYSIKKPLGSDSSKIKIQESDSVATQSADTLTASPHQSSNVPKTEAPSSSKMELSVTQKGQTSDNQPPKMFVNKKHQIRKGERLNTIASQEYGHKAFWVYIYDENRNKIDNPDLINPGMIIDIPPAEKYRIDKNNQESVNKALELEQKYKW
jgi:nucleoid DNA-binding protein